MMTGNILTPFGLGHFSNCNCIADACIIRVYVATRVHNI